MDLYSCFKLETLLCKESIQFLYQLLLEPYYYLIFNPQLLWCNKRYISAVQKEASPLVLNSIGLRQLFIVDVSRDFTYAQIQYRYCQA